MRHLCIIDPDIQGFGGHHYQYAQRLSKAFVDSGWRVTVIGSRESALSNESGVCVPLPLLRFSLRDKLTITGLGGTSKRLAQFVPRGLRGTLLRLRFSRLLLIVAQARSASLSELVFLRYPQPLGSPLPSPRFVLLLIWPWTKTLGGMRRYALSRNFFSALLQVLRTLGIILAGLIVWPFALIVSVSTSVSMKTLVARDIRRALRIAGVPPGTLVVVPNASLVDLQALGSRALRRRSVEGLEWLLVYRRPLEEVSPISRVQNADKSAFLMRSALSDLRSQCSNVLCALATDTEELTSEYSRALGEPFFTLPVPAETYRFTTKPERSVITISYLGDARDEKGFGQIPDLINYLSYRSGDLPKYRILLQSNPNGRFPEPDTKVALDYIATNRPIQVETFMGPVSDMEYARVLLESDVILLPYEASSYTTRSSGIFMEAIANGVVPVVTGGTWMSNIVEPARQMWLETKERHLDLNDELQSMVCDAGQGEGVWLTNAECNARTLFMHISKPEHYASQSISVQVIQRQGNRFPQLMMDTTVHLNHGIARLACSIGPGRIEIALAPTRDPLTSLRDIKVYAMQSAVELSGYDPGVAVLGRASQTLGFAVCGVLKDLPTYQSQLAWLKHHIRPKYDLSPVPTDIDAALRLRRNALSGGAF